VQEQKLYLEFFVQLLVCHLIPGCLFNHWLTKQMLTMHFRKVQRSLLTYQICNSLLVAGLVTLGFTIYNCMDLFNAVHSGTFLTLTSVMIVYIYLAWWSTLAFCFVVIGLAWIATACCTWLRRKLGFASNRRQRTR